ncbi:hypothetical protein ARZXY2_3707 [Arthrobacter sp. ZXY-2]|nr:hypothetical protein ARZXY2_3707 [Arthrobacter sp. ZXY-2]
MNWSCMAKFPAPERWLLATGIRDRELQCSAGPGKPAGKP